MREIKIGSIYKHFKNKYYIVLDIVNDCESNDEDYKKIVIYQALYKDKITWARDYESFISEVDHEKYPNVIQKYRFQELDLDNEYLDSFKKEIIKYNEIKDKLSKDLTEELKKIDKD